MFMEGLPRSGKSYETCIYYIIEALKKGRPVDAYVEGLNHEMFSDFSGQPLELIQELLVYISKDQVPEIWKHARKDALVVIDELQDFFQAGRQKMTDEMTTFVTQHGHEGQDLIGMGQDLNDVHNIWKRRCDRKFVFTKQDAIGRPTHYTWEAYKGQRTATGIKFVKINSGSREYEKKYYGLYKSHSDGTTNFESFEDSRTNIFSGKGLRYGVPAALLIVGYSIWYLVTVVFSGTGMVSDDQLSSAPAPNTKVSTDFQRLEASYSAIPVAPLEPEKPKLEQVAPTEYIDDLASRYKLRLAGIMNISGSDQAIIYMQAFDNSMHLKESMNSMEILALGWDIEITAYGALLSKNDTKYVVRSWPIENPFGKTNSRTLEKL